MSALVGGLKMLLITGSYFLILGGLRRKRLPSRHWKRLPEKVVKISIMRGIVLILRKIRLKCARVCYRWGQLWSRSMAYGVQIPVADVDSSQAEGCYSTWMAYYPTQGNCLMVRGRTIVCELMSPSQALR